MVTGGGLEAEDGGYGGLSPQAGQHWALSAAWPRDGEAWLPTEKLKSHSHRLRETSTLRLTTFMPLLHQSWPPVLKKAMIQDREAESTGCVIQKRATDSGISETNLTLVF